jgi:hypothetical protein
MSLGGKRLSNFLLARTVLEGVAELPCKYNDHMKEMPGQSMLITYFYE